LTPNWRFWRRILDGDFIPQLRGLVETLETRVLPAFADIDQEAERYTNDLWKDVGAMPGTGDDNMDQIAEAVRDAGVERYMLLNDLRQGVVNLFAASLYHAFEQQVLSFHRRELLSPAEQNDSRLFTVKEFHARLLGHGIDLHRFETWPAINELRLLANTVKHAEGESAQRLHEIRPDFFRQAGFPELGEWVTRWKPRVFQPLAGKDLYVDAKDIKLYLESLLKFWEEFWVALSRT
jgi:hypothetical protein